MSCLQPSMSQAKSAVEDESAWTRKITKCHPGSTSKSGTVVTVALGEGDEAVTVVEVDTSRDGSMSTH